MARRSAARRADVTVDGAVGAQMPVSAGRKVGARRACACGMIEGGANTQRDGDGDVCV